MSVRLLLDRVRRPSGALLASMHGMLFTLAGQLINIVSGVLGARMLGVEGRGLYQGLALWGTLVVAFGAFGVADAATFFISRSPAAQKSIIRQTYLVSILQSAVLTPLLYLILFLWSRGKSSDVHIAAVITGMMVIGLIAHQCGQAILLGQHRFLAWNICRHLPGAVYALLVVCLYLFGKGNLPTLSAAWVGGLLLAAVAANVLALMRADGDDISKAPRRREIVFFGMRGFLGSLSPVDNLPVDQAAVALWLSPFQLGLYVVASAFTNIPRFVSQSIGPVIYSVVAAARPHERPKRLIWRYFWAVMLLNIALTAILILLMPVAIRLAFGSAFAGATPVAQVLVVGTSLVACRQILVSGLQGLGQPGTSTLAEISMYPWLIVGVPLLMWKYQLQGLVWALTIGYAVSLAVAVACMLKARGSRAVVSPSLLSIE